MKNYIALYPNEYEKDMNNEIISGFQDTPIEDFIVMAMKEFEAINNIKIESIENIRNQDEMDVNRHMININYKKKDMDSIEIPKYKYILESRFGEMIFGIRVTTNLNEKYIVKRILYPIEYNGAYYNNGKRMKSIWQLVDKSTYSQRGKNTLKSRMPIIIYQSRKRVLTDIHGEQYTCTSYSYALNGRARKPTAKVKVKFINPLMIYSAKMGYMNSIGFFGMNKIVSIETIVKNDFDKYLYFPLNDVYIKVLKDKFNKYELVRNFVAMSYNLSSIHFPVSLSNIDDQEYWVCRIGTIGAANNKNLSTFREKGITTIYMIERLLDATTIMNLRLPDYYKNNIYYLLYWMMTNFDECRKYSNIDMNNKRIRKNEYIVNPTLGKKINENINRLIEKRGKSRLNDMNTLLELFNFGSDIIISGMRNLNDLIKTDDIVNDNDFILDLAYSSKGPNSLGDGNNKKIAVKYRYLHPSMAGRLDLNTSSNSDIGLSGSFTPFVKLYDKFYFTPEPEPCLNRFLFDLELQDEGFRKIHGLEFDDYIKWLEKHDPYKALLTYEPIEIIEKET